MGDDTCPKSKRVDGKHGLLWDGDEPRTVCVWCGEVRDAIDGRVIVPGFPAARPHPQPTEARP